MKYVPLNRKKELPMLKKLLRLSMLSLLLTSCAHPSVQVPRPVTKCRLPVWPSPPKLEAAEPCGENALCLTLESAVNIGLWARDTERVHQAAESCPHVYWETVVDDILKPMSAIDPAVTNANLPK